MTVVEGCGLGKVLGTDPPGGSPAIMTSVIMTTEGGGYKFQYSLQDNNLRYTAARGSMAIRFADSSDEEYYLDILHVSKKDFKKFKTLLGQEIWAHVFIIPSQDVRESGSGKRVTVYLDFVIAGSLKEFNVSDTLRL